GEQLDDLILFDKVAFVQTLFKGVANA
ncbi:MAG: hypothetical protein RL423_718, partial [Bacteroidota bacterium]